MHMLIQYKLLHVFFFSTLKLEEAMQIEIEATWPTTRFPNAATEKDIHTHSLTNHNGHCSKTDIKSH